MDIRVLKYFAAVAKEGNISRAAESLHITQPSLSKQLMELENELGKQLLVRGKRKVTLTDSGALLLKRAEEIIALFDKTQQEICCDEQAVSGTVSVGGLATPSVLSAAATLRGKYPQVSFDFYSSDATDVTQRLDHGSLDFAVLLEPVDALKYEYISLPDHSCWGLLMPKACELAKKEFVEKEDLRLAPLIFHSRIGLQREIAHWTQTDIGQLHIAATYNILGGNTLAYVQSGLGYLLTGRNHFPDDLGPELCFRALAPTLELKYALVWKRYAILSKAAQAFLAHF